MIKQFLVILILFLSFFLACNKSNLTQSIIGVTLDLDDPAYNSLMIEGANVELPAFGLRGLYIMRTDAYGFVIYDLFNPNIDKSTGNNCSTELVAQLNVLTDLCNNIHYDVLTGKVISVPDGVFVTPKPLIKYDYTLTTDTGRQILYIL